MSKTMTLTLPDEVYDAIVEAAKAEGESPQKWIVSQLPKVGKNGSARESVAAPASPTCSGETLADLAIRLGSIDKGKLSSSSQGAQGTLAEALGSYIGSVRSDSPKPLSEDTGKAFTDYLEQKRREERL